MKKTTASILSAVLLASVFFSPGVSAEGAQANIVTEPGVQYKTHIQDYGWETAWKRDGSLSGTVGEWKRLEALVVELTGSLPAEANIQTYVHVQNRGNLGPFAMGDEAGTSGEGLRLEQIRLVLNNMSGYRLLYNVQVQNKGWLKDVNNEENWFKSGETAGTSGEGLRLEGIRIKIVEVNEEYEAYLSTLSAAKEASYTSESWAIYKKVVDANQVSKTNTKDEIKEATANIIAAQKKLVSAKNLTAYNAALAAVKEAEYTPDTWAVYQEVVDENVMTKQNTQAEISTATNNILEAQKKLQHKVNLTEYRATLEAVRQEDYTAQSWAVYQNTLMANIMTENNTQTEVDAAIKKIDEAQKKMVRKFDFTAYNALLNAVKEEDYIESTWAVYQEVVDANVVDETNTQSAIEQAIKNIEAAQRKLVKKADLTYYNAVLNAVNKEDYTTVSWNEYQKVVRSEVVNPTSKPEVIDEAVTKILAAQLNLVPAGDMIYYYAAINKVIRTDFTTASWAVYQKVVDANVVIPADGQAAIDAAIEKIEAAQKKLVPAADMTDYENVLNAVDKDDYTSVSWATYQKVVDTNYVVKGAGQTAVDTAMLKIEAAQQKLVPRGDLTAYWDVLKYNLYLGPDKTVLMDSKQYTTASWATYQKVLDANAMDADKSQTQIDAAVAKIKTAQIKLAKAGILTAYEELLKFNLYRAPDKSIPMRETDYTSASWIAYQKILSANEMDRDKSQAQIDAAVVKIERAQAKLVEKGGISAYLATLNLVKEEDWTVKSWTAYEKLLSTKGYFVTSDNSQAEIDRAIELIKAAQRNLKKKGDTSAYNALVALQTDQNKFKTTPWKAYQAILNKYLMTSENTQQQIDDAIVIIRNAQTALTLPENAASILTAYNAMLAKPDAQSSYTPTSWTAYQNAIKTYLGYTKDTDQNLVNNATKAIEDAQLLLVRTNETELKAFQGAIEMYLRNDKNGGSLAAKVTTDTWSAYETQVKNYAGKYSDSTWQPTVINKDSRPEVINEATAAIQKTIRKLRPNTAVLVLDYTDYDDAVEAAVPWMDDPDIWGTQTVALVAPIYTEKSYDDYVKACKSYEILNYIESAPTIEMTQHNIAVATNMIDLAQGSLYKRAVKVDLDNFKAEFGKFVTLNKDSYTEQSWSNYETVYLNSTLDLNNPQNIRQEDCQAMTAALQTARTALVPVP
jgi:uncharacterized protein YjdB